MNEQIERLIESQIALTNALMDQSDLISQLVNSITLLIDTEQQHDDESMDDEQSDHPVYLLDGTRIS